MSLKKIFVLLSLCTGSYLYATMAPMGFERFPNHYFVETGTFVGDGVSLALRANFPEIYSIEIDDTLVKKAQVMFQEFKNISIIHGDSGLLLWEIIKNMNQPITFWLDGHNSSGTPLSFGRKNTPLLDELEQIKLHPIKTHTILIDDIRLLGTWEFDFTTKAMLIKKVLEINPNYVISYVDGYCKDDIMVAQIKVTQP